jgi:phosphocarrier protein HPr
MSVLEATLEVKNRLGLHLRASSTLAQTINRFRSNVTISRGKNEVNGRSITGLMMLGASQGTKLNVRVEGEDAPAAMEAIRKVFQERFGED